MSLFVAGSGGAGEIRSTGAAATLIGLSLSAVFPLQSRHSWRPSETGKPQLPQRRKPATALCACGGVEAGGSLPASATATDSPAWSLGEFASECGWSALGFAAFSSRRSGAVGTAAGAVSVSEASTAGTAGESVSTGVLTPSDGGAAESEAIPGSDDKFSAFSGTLMPDELLSEGLVCPSAAMLVDGRGPARAALGVSESGLALIG